MVEGSDECSSRGALLFELGAQLGGALAGETLHLHVEAGVREGGKDVGQGGHDDPAIPVGKAFLGLESVAGIELTDMGETRAADFARTVRRSVDGGIVHYDELAV